MRTPRAPDGRPTRLAFKTLFGAGLVERRPRIVNWGPRGRSAISDEEIDWQEHTDPLYYLKYPVDGGMDITVATVRPETMLGDSGVAVICSESLFFLSFRPFFFGRGNVVVGFRCLLLEWAWRIHGGETGGAGEGRRLAHFRLHFRG